MITFDNEGLYIQSAKSIKEKITKIDEVIAALWTSVLEAAKNDHVQSYSLNDGQVQIRSDYRSTEAVMKSIKGLEKMKHYYIAQINGRVFGAKDASNFRRR